MGRPTAPTRSDGVRYQHADGLFIRVGQPAGDAANLEIRHEVCRITYTQPHRLSECQRTLNHCLHTGIRLLI
jgi:hypothetical protein